MIVLLIKDRTLRFCKIVDHISVISGKVLTDQLREMEEDYLLHRQEFKELPPRVEYFLTKKGITLLPILDLLAEWEREFEIKESEIKNIV